MVSVPDASPGAARFTLKLRVPAWADSQHVSVTKNGQAIACAAAPVAATDPDGFAQTGASFCDIGPEWSSGDVGAGGGPFWKPARGFL